MNIESLIKILQASIVPVVLISSAGLLLLSITNRLGRSIDRARQLCHLYESATPEKTKLLKEQIDILFDRCQMLRFAVALLTVCIGCVSVIILSLFLIYIFNVDLVGFVEFLFAVGMVTLIGSMIYFLLDIRYALSSLKIEIDNTYRNKK